MLIKMICGNYGFRPDKNSAQVLRKDKTSPAFDVDEAEANRLISMGVAQAVAISQDEENTGANVNFNANFSESAIISEAEIMSLDFNTLRKLAKNMGFDTKGTKEELQKRLVSALAYNMLDETQEDVETECDVPPELVAQEPV